MLLQYLWCIGLQEAGLGAFMAPLWSEETAVSERERLLKFVGLCFHFWKGVCFQARCRAAVRPLLRAFPREAEPGAAAARWAELLFLYNIRS